MPPKIFIIILNWNGKKDTLECLSSVEKINYQNFEVVVVDNGSSDDSVSVIKTAFPQITLLETGKNLGYAEGNNVGIRYAMDSGADFLFILNNDTTLDPEILTHFAEGFKEKPEAGILGAKIYLYHERNKFDHLGGKWNRKTFAFDLIAQGQIDDGKTWETMEELDYVCGAGFMVRKEVVTAIGLFEPKFFLYWEDADFCYRARKYGFKIMTCPNSKLWHKVSSSFVGGKVHSSYFIWRNRLLWIERNLSRSDKLCFFFRAMAHLLKTYKLKVIKSSQLLFLRFFYSKDEINKRKERIRRYQAVIQGTKDYLLRNFGDGPSWIYKKKED
ncbi:MAG TPA: glycosyltransferase family 2 protein [Rhabdochlamydiaceae bacterium]|nr:glycosyltransferase family 2 protein [Rhabdochlamydiaceae bacterium]